MKPAVTHEGMRGGGERGEVDGEEGERGNPHLMCRQVMVGGDDKGGFKAFPGGGGGHTSE